MNKSYHARGRPAIASADHCFAAAMFAARPTAAIAGCGLHDYPGYAATTSGHLGARADAT